MNMLNLFISCSKKNASCRYNVLKYISFLQDWFVNIFCCLLFSLIFSFFCCVLNAATITFLAYEALNSVSSRYKLRLLDEDDDLLPQLDIKGPLFPFFPLILLFSPVMHLLQFNPYVFWCIQHRHFMHIFWSFPCLVFFFFPSSSKDELLQIWNHLIQDQRRQQELPRDW